MKSLISSLSFLSLVLSFNFELVAGQRRRPNNGGGNTNGGVNAASGQADGTAQLSTATDGSTIMDATVNINGLPIRFKIAAPASQFLASTGVPGANGSANATTEMGLNVLLHGDGGQSFFDFPNQAVQANLMGVVALAPDPNLFWGGGSGLQRTNGVAHSAAVNSLVQDVLPQAVNFNKANVFFTGVSGGALTLSGFFVPNHMAQYRTGVMLQCGAMAPQVPIQDPANMLAATRIHFQSTQNELAMLQQSIPQSVQAYSQAATQMGLTPDQVGQLQTVDNSVQGGHCAFDGQEFVSGVQLMTSSYSSVMQQGGTGEVPGIGNVKKSVIGNERLTFGPAPRLRTRTIKHNLRRDWGTVTQPKPFKS